MKKQIVVQPIIKALVNQIPGLPVSPTNLDQTSFFGYGTEDELNKQLKARKEIYYPLVWLLPTMSTNAVKSNIARRKITLVIATVACDDEFSNNFRYENSFDKVLFPIRDYMVHMLNNSKLSRIYDDEATTYEYPNYVVQEKNSGGKYQGNALTRWDAIRLEVDIEFYSNQIECIRQFNFS